MVNWLSEHNLIFPVHLAPDTPEPWRIIDPAFHEHLRTHELKLKRPVKDDGNRFHFLAWDVLGRKSKAQETFQTGLADLDKFTVQFLNRQVTEVMIESTGSKLSCVMLGMCLPRCPQGVFRSTPVLAPIQGNLRGPISNLDEDAPVHHLAHACFPWRLLACFQWLKFKTNTQGSRCINRECPNRSSLRRQRSPSTTVRTLARRPTVSEPISTA